jgi:hypothetical protein
MAAPKSSRPMEKIHATPNVGSRSGPILRYCCRWAVAPAHCHGRRLFRLRAGGPYALNCLRYDVSGTHLSRRPNGPPNFVRPSSVFVLIAVRTFIPIRVSPAKAAINSDRAIAGKQMGALLPCQERSASHRPARSNYPLKTEFPRGPRLAADARLQPSAHNAHFGASPAGTSLVIEGRLDEAGAAFGKLCTADRG